MNDTFPERRVLVILTQLTFVSGIIDAVSYLGMGHVFAANMTGNVVIFGFAAAGATGFAVSGSLTALTAFLVGAAIAGRLRSSLGNERRMTLIRISLSVEVLFLTTAVLATEWAWHTNVVIALLALPMGLRNATIRALGIPDMTTTVLTLTLTGLAADSSVAGGSNPRATRRIVSVAAMLGGALLGAWLYLHHGTLWPLLLAAVVAATAGLVSAAPTTDRQ